MVLSKPEWEKQFGVSLVTEKPEYVIFRTEVINFPSLPVLSQPPPTAATHVCTSGQLSGSGRRRRSPGGSVGSDRLPCGPGTSDIGRWRGRTLPGRWSPRCRCTRTSRMVGSPRSVPGGRHNNRLRTSDSASLHTTRGVESIRQELDGWLSCSAAGGRHQSLRSQN